MQSDYKLDYPAVVQKKEQKLHLMVRLVGGVQVQSKKRLPLNLSVVLDRSGSMAGEKLEYVKKAAQFLVQHLNQQDHFSLVTYNHDVTINLEPQTVSDKERITRAIEKLTAGGTTNLSGGWLQGCQLVSQNLAEQSVNRVLLLTDGLANQGVTDTTRLTEMARQKRGDRITTTTMGVGMDFNEDLLTKMASEGGGAFYFIDNPDQTPHIFAEELRDLLTVVAQNVMISFTPAAMVQNVTQLNTYSTEPDDGKAKRFRLGDVYSEEEKVLLLEFTVKAQENLGQASLGQLRIEYDEIAANSTIHHVLDYSVEVAIVTESAFAEIDQHPEVGKLALMLEAARARDKAVKFADQGDFEKANAVLSKAADDIQESKFQDKELLSEHNMLREEAIDMALGAERYNAYSRKSTTSKVFYSTQRNRREETVLMHGRLKASRKALERHGQSPGLIKWKREQLKLDMERLRIGRATDNDIVIHESEVSDHHCEIIKRDDHYVLVDLGSTNGTYANGGRVEGEFRLSIGDVLTVGSWLFMFDR